MALSRVKVAERVAAPADKVWEYIGAFNGLPKIMRNLVPSSEMSQVGNVRKLKLAGARKHLRERLLKIDNKTRTQVYEVIDEPNTPVPFVNYVATIKVKPTSARACMVEWSSQFEVKKGADAGEARELATLVYTTGIAGAAKAAGVAVKKKAAPKKKAAAKKAPAKKTAAKKKAAAEKKATPKKKAAAKKR